MESIRDRVAIVGAGCSQFGELWNKSPEDLIVDACTEAFEDAGLQPNDMQAAWFGNFSTGHRGTKLAVALKLPPIPITRVENNCATGTDAFINASYAIAAGVYDFVLVCGAEKLKDYGFSGLPTSAPAAPEIAESEVRPTRPMPVQFAMLALSYFKKYGISLEEGKRILAKIVVKNHHNGTFSPKAHFRREVSLETVINAPMVAHPLGLYDCCGVSDGCAVAVLTRPELAKKLRDDFVLVKGLGMSSGAEYAEIKSEFDFTYWEENLWASRQAYKDAGIHNPREQIDIASVHDCFSINELLTYEDLGFSPRGKAKEDVESGFFTMEGGLPVNTDGGLKCFGHPLGASGIRMIYEIYKQIQGKAGPRQVKNVNMGLTHNIGGWPGAMTSAISILGRRD